MTTFFRLMNDEDKQQSLKLSVDALNNAEARTNTHIVSPNEFLSIPGSSFAYWVSSEVRNSFDKFTSTDSSIRTARQGLATSDDFRFVRAAWEQSSKQWPLFAKGGEYATYYSDVHLRVNWKSDGAEIKALICQKYPYLNGAWGFVAKNTDYYFLPGLTWSLRTQKGLGVRVLPGNCVFSHKGPSVFCSSNQSEDLFSTLAVVNSCAYKYLVDLQMCFGSYEVGAISKTPMPELTQYDIEYLSKKAKSIWQSKRKFDATDETSHAYLLPKLLLTDDFMNSDQAITDIKQLQQDIDTYCFNLFEFSDSDKQLALESHGEDKSDYSKTSVKEDLSGVISWSVGVAFGRFDIAVFTNRNERKFENYNIEPFAPLSDISPGMSRTSSRYHEHNGVLHSEEGDEHSLPILVAQVLESVGADHNVDLSKWLKNDFFTYHLKQYTKSRRQAPIYWPIQTASGSYTLWLYYPELNSQSLYVCINDFIEPKLRQVTDELSAVRLKQNRTTNEDKELSALVELESEMKDLSDEILRIAQFWKPNLNDGVQVLAAPLWKLFQHKPWQTKLKKTWQELEQGKYDWSHMAINIWPERVLRKCHQDRSIAIAHDVEAELWHEVEVKAVRGKGAKWEWQPKELTPQELNRYIQQKLAQLKES
ncbi:hypothetical protein [Vibrio sp.]|uniref:hypothetical protein n=1 Tax=Vibrio sp. TaxID=678 RepID=UPI003F6D8424